MPKEQLSKLIFELITISQSITIGFFVFVLGLKKTNSWIYLGLFLILYACSDLPFLLETLDIIKLESTAMILSSCVLFLAPTAYYMYVHSLLIVTHKKTFRRLVIFGTFSFLIGMICFWNGFFHADELLYDIYEILSNLYVFFVFGVITVQIYRHNSLLKQQYSNVKHRELVWVLNFTLLLLVSFFIAPLVFSLFNLNVFFEDLFFSTVSFIWLLGVIYNGLFYKFSENLLPKEDFDLMISKNKSKVKYEDQKEDNSLVELFTRIEKIFSEKKLYLNVELTIADVAYQVDSHPKTVSQVINKFSHQNFSTFVNIHRVQHAADLLVDAAHLHISIEGIGNKSGFKTNSVFYTAFKKEMKMTPLQYQKQNKKKI